MLFSEVTSGGYITDHSCTIITLKTPSKQKQPLGPRKIVRKISKIDINALRHDFINTQLIKSPPGSIDELCSAYNSTLTQLLNQHAPCVSVKPRAINDSWITPSVIAAKQKKRQLERIWLKHKTPYNRSKFRKQINLFNKICFDAKCLFYAKRIQQHE